MTAPDSAPTKQVGTRVFAFGMMPPSVAIRVQVVVAKAIGEPIFKMFAASKEAGASTESAMAAAGAQAMGMLAQNINPDELVRTMETVLQFVTTGGQRVNIDSTFMGQTRDLWAVFIEALRVNFADFFPAGASGSPPGTAGALSSG